MNSESVAAGIGWLRHCLFAGAVLVGHNCVCRAEFIVILDDRSAFEALLTVRSSSTVIDTEGRFAPDPGTETIDGVTRAGTIGGETYRYRATDVDFSNSPTGRISPGNIGDDIHDLDRVSIEAPVGQGGAIGTGSWGLDSGSGSTQTPNALLVDFEVTPFDEGIYHFGADLHDFETSDEFGPGQIRLYDDGELTFASPFAWAGSNGNGKSHFLGVVGARPFDQVAIIIGDDDGNGAGTERWAADRLTFGRASNPEPASSMLALGIVAVAATGRRLRSRKSGRESKEFSHEN